MGKSNLNLTTNFIVLFVLVHVAASASFRQKSFSFDSFNHSIQHLFTFRGDQAVIYNDALQLTPEAANDDFMARHYNKAGRIMFHEPFRLWLSGADDDSLASFNSTFVINIYREKEWDAGHGLAFLIAPTYTVPEASHGQWLGLTNASTDGNSSNHIIAIEFDTEKQEFDPDDNHIGLNINSVRSSKNVSLSDYNITISPAEGTNYGVWVEYDGNSKLMKVYMVEEGQPKPSTPLLSETINLKHYLKQDSYFGFAASTGQPQIELNCVLKWSLSIDDIPRKNDRIWLKIGAGVGAAVLIILLVLFFAVYVHKRKRNKVKEGDKFGKLRWLPGMPREFKYKELKKATNNFHENLKLGEGGFGIVFKGILHDKDPQHNTPSEIAVKKFTRDNIKSKDDFLAELTIIHRIRHKHLVRLVGWCYEKRQLLLVYEFMPNGSLEKHLYVASGQKTLDWGLRYKILAGIASALHYLHNEYDQKVVHRDLKASNILLDKDYNARLGDFGLARALENERNSYAELGLGGVPGTIGYVAPECFHTGSATPESDVFGFGAVVLEVVCGRSPGEKIHQEQRVYTLVDWVWTLHREGRIEDAVDERLNSDFVAVEARRLLHLGLACSHPIASERPQTQAIFQIITGTLSVPSVPPFKPVFTWPSMNTDSSVSSITLSSQDCGVTPTAAAFQRSSSGLPV